MPRNKHVVLPSTFFLFCLLLCLLQALILPGCPHTLQALPRRFSTRGSQNSTVCKTTSLACTHEDLWALWPLPLHSGVLDSSGTGGVIDCSAQLQSEDPREHPLLSKCAALLRVSRASLYDRKEVLQRHFWWTGWNHQDSLEGRVQMASGHGAPDFVLCHIFLGPNPLWEQRLSQGPVQRPITPDAEPHPVPSPRHPGKHLWLLRPGRGLCGT